MNFFFMKGLPVIGIDLKLRNVYYNAVEIFFFKSFFYNPENLFKNEIFFKNNVCPAAENLVFGSSILSKSRTNCRVAPGTSLSPHGYVRARDPKLSIQ